MQLSSVTQREIYVQNIVTQIVRFTLVPRISEYISSVRFWTNQAREKILIVSNIFDVLTRC